MTAKEIAEFKKENSKYINNELVKPLKLTDKELIIYFPKIKAMVDDAEACKNNGNPRCCINESFMHNVLERQENGSLRLVSTPCPKKKLHDCWIQNDYICDSQARSLPTMQSIAKEHKQDSEKNSKCNKLECIKQLLNIKDQIKKNEKPRGLYIYGPYGVGKSFLLYRFCEMLQELGKTTAFISAPETIRRFKNTFSDDSPVGPEYYENKMIDVDVLVIDDLGSEIPAKWFYNDFLINVLNKRMSEEKLTLFTSNYTLKGLLSKWAKEAKMLNVDVGRIGERIKALTGNREFRLDDKGNRY